MQSIFRYLPWRFLLFLGLSLGLQAAWGKPYQPHKAQFAPDVSPDQIAAHLIRQFPSLQVPNVTLTLAHERLSPGGRHLHFTPTCQAIPIYAQGLKANLDRAGRLRSVLPYNLQQVQTPSLPIQWVDEGLLLQKYQKSLGSTHMHHKRYWLAEAGNLRPVIRLESYQEGPIHAYEILVDGRTGRELQRQDIGAYCHPMDDSSGLGRIFNPDPCTRAEAPYGDLFSDNGDVHSMVLEQLMDTVALLDLRWDGGLYYLEGPYIKIEDIQPFSLEPATSSDGRFVYPRDDHRFEDVMVYFHVDRYQRYVQSLGFTNLQNNPFRADPHGLGNSDQSVFVGNQGNSYMLFGDGGVDDAEDADVIVHEYGHALSYAASPETRIGFERQGLDEGIGDYIAASYSYDLNAWRWFEVFNWDGHNEFWPGRDLLNSGSYPLAAGASIYDIGVLWASCLMMGRMELGSEIMDRLFFESLYGMVPNMTLRDAANLVLEADQILYSGAHQTRLTRLFCDFNLLNNATCLAVSLPDLPPARIHLRPDPYGSYAWEPYPAPVQLTLINAMGQALWQASVPADQAQRIPTEGLATGVYWLRVLGTDQQQHIPILR